MMTEKNSSGAGSYQSGRRDFIIVISVLVLITAAYLLLKKPQPVPQAHGGMADTKGITGMTDMLGELPEDYASLVNMGNDYMDHGNFAIAAEAYRRALEIDGSSPDVRTDFGACLHGMGLAERALEEFLQVIEEHPSHAIVHYNLGIVYFYLEKKDSARFYWESYLAIEPDGRAAESARQYLSGLGG